MTKKTTKQTMAERTEQLMDRRRQIKKQIKIVIGPGGHYIVAIPGLNGAPCDVLYDSLQCIEAAEIALDSVLGRLHETGQPYGPREDPVANWNQAGRVLRFLRDYYEAEDLTPPGGPVCADSCDASMGLAQVLVDQRPWEPPYNGNPDDIPF